MKRLIYLQLLSLLVGIASLQGQNSHITGGLQTNANFFIADDKRVGTGIPQYDYQKFGAESWLNLNYSNWGFDMGLRFDLFNNSNLLNPSAIHRTTLYNISYCDSNVNMFLVNLYIIIFCCCIYSLKL